MWNTFNTSLNGPMVWPPHFCLF